MRWLGWERWRLQVSGRHSGLLPPFVVRSSYPRSSCHRLLGSLVFLVHVSSFPSLPTCTVRLCRNHLTYPNPILFSLFLSLSNVFLPPSTCSLGLLFSSSSSSSVWKTHPSLFMISFVVSFRSEYSPLPPYPDFNPFDFLSFYPTILTSTTILFAAPG